MGDRIISYLFEGGCGRDFFFFVFLICGNVFWVVIIEEV